MLLLSAYLAATVCIIFWIRMASVKVDRAADIAFLAATFAAIFTVRFPSFSHATPLNVDEALFAANAMRSYFGWTNWGMIDPTTSGPLNSIILTWPHIFGGDITLYSGRVTAALIACGVTGFVYASARRITPQIWAIIATLPCALFYTTTRNFDFIHYSSEQLPVLLIAGSIYFLICFAQRPTKLSCGIAAVLAGSIPFAKLQGLPWAALLGLAILVVACTCNPGRVRKSALIALTIVFGSLPAVLFLLPLVFTGDFDDFVKSYLLQQYLRKGSEKSSIIALLTMASSVRAFTIAAAAITAICAALVLSSLRKRSWPELSKVQSFLIILTLLALSVAFSSVLLPGRNYQHYLLFLIPALSLASISATSIVASFCSGIAIRRTAFILIGLGSILPTLALLSNELSYDRHLKRAFKGLLTEGPTSPNSLSWLRPKSDDTIVCWGWQPECYVESGLKSATRDGTNENQLYSTELRPYFRERFLADFSRSTPAFVIDFVAPGGFGFDHFEYQSIKTFPEFNKMIEAEFGAMSKVDPPSRCPRLFVRRSRLETLEKTLVEFDTIEGPSAPEAPPRAVDDRSTFESCRDYWLLPERTTGTLAISFRKPSEVRTVEILNTRNGPTGDRAADRIRLTLVRDGRPVLSRDIRLNRFPRWTKVDIESTPEVADSLKLEILSYFGNGGGLNEVKVYSGTRSGD